jgi:predicted acyl esterase
VAIARELSNFHSAVALDGVTAPLLLQSGWTDDLFPASESLRVYEQFRRSRPARVALQLGDLGHSRGSNKRNADRTFNEQGARFFDSLLRRTGTPPARNSVTAFLQTCPQARSATGPIRARSWARLHPGVFRLRAGGARRIRSGAGSEAVAKAFDKNSGGDACATVRSQRSRGTAVYEQRVRRSFTMLGLPTIRATLRTAGRGGVIAGRLWDVFRGRQRLISRGVYRLRDNQRGRVSFQLNGNGWRFARGHRVKLELLGRDPNAYRTSNNRFAVRVSRLIAELPTRERPSRRLGIAKPILDR